MKQIFSPTSTPFVLCIIFFPIFAWCDIKGLGFIPALQGIVRVLAWLAALLSSITLIFYLRYWPSLVRPFRSVLVLAIIVMAIFYGLTLVIGRSIVQAHCYDKVLNIEYIAIESGGFGGTWVNIVERKVFFGIFQRERSINTLERGSVVALRLSNGNELDIEVSEYGRDNKIVKTQLHH